MQNIGYIVLVQLVDPHLCRTSPVQETTKRAGENSREIGGDANDAILCQNCDCEASKKWIDPARSMCNLLKGKTAVG